MNRREYFKWLATDNQFSIDYHVVKYKPKTDKDTGSTGYWV